MPYNQYGQWVEDTGFAPMPGAGMPSVTSGGATLGPGGWSDAGPWRTVNDPRERYSPLYDHTHMDEASAFGGMLGPGYGQNTPQRSRALQLLQGLQQQRQQPLQGFAQPGIYQNDPTDPRQSQFSQYGGASQGRGGAVDNVYTGHATERLREDPRILGMIPQIQRQLYGGGPSIGNLVTGQDGVSRLAQITARSPLSDDEAHAKFMGYVQQQMGRGTMDAEQASALHSHVFGLDPQAYQDRAKKNAESSVELQNKALDTQQKTFNLSKGFEDQLETSAKSLYGIPAADALQTAGYHFINPTTGEGLKEGDPAGKWVYSVFDKGNYQYSKDDPTQVVGKTPPHWIGARQPDIEWLKRLQASRDGRTSAQAEPYLMTGPDIPNSPAAQRIARGQELAKHENTPDSRPSLTSWIWNPDNAAQVTQAPWTNVLSPMTVAPVNAGLQGFDYMLNGGGLQSLQNAGSNAAGSLPSALDFIRRFYGGGGGR